MCDPLTIAGVVLTGASAAANSAAQSSVQKARDDAMSAERIRQKGYDQQADATNAHAQGQYEDFQPKQDERATKLGDYFKSQNAQPVTDAGPVAMPASSSNVTNIATEKASTDAKAFTDKQGASLGQLRSFGDLLGEYGRGTARDAITVGQIGGFKKGSSAVLPYELEAANGKGAGMKTFGDILGGLGKIGVSAGLSGATPFGIGAASSGNVANAGANFVPGGAYSYGAGGYTGMGPFLNPGTQPSGGLFSLFGR